MAFRLAVLAAVSYLGLCAIAAIGAKTMFDAAWLLATLSVPASTIADSASRIVAHWFFNDQKDVLVDMVFLSVFGAAEYGLLGYIVGKIVTKLVNR